MNISIPDKVYNVFIQLQRIYVRIQNENMRSGFLAVIRELLQKKASSTDLEKFQKYFESGPFEYSNFKDHNYEYKQPVMNTVITNEMTSEAHKIISEICDIILTSFADITKYKFICYFNLVMCKEIIMIYLKWTKSDINAFNTFIDTNALHKYILDNRIIKNRNTNNFKEFLGSLSGKYNFSDNISDSDIHNSSIIKIINWIQTRNKQKNYVF